MMKKLFCTAIACLGLLGMVNAYALDIHLQFNNNTDQSLRPEGTITYDKEGETHWNEPIQPPVTYIPAHAQDAPADELRVGLSDYFLEYFELFDRDGKYVTNCLESYVAVTKQNAIVTFTLTQIGKQNPRYVCNYKVQYIWGYCFISTTGTVRCAPTLDLSRRADGASAGVWIIKNYQPVTDPTERPVLL